VFHPVGESRSRCGTRIPARSRHVPACGRRYTNVSRGRCFGIAGRRMALWRLRRVGSIRHCSCVSRALRAPLDDLRAARSNVGAGRRIALWRLRTHFARSVSRLTRGPIQCGRFARVFDRLRRDEAATVAHLVTALHSPLRRSLSIRIML
jgi:hypothetical protein